MSNALLYLGAILVAAFAALFAVPYFVDWNSYRGVFEEEASRVLGRQVRVGGTVNLRLLPAPYVSFEKLRIADAGGEGGTSVFRADSFTMWLSVPPLLRGVLEANQVQLRRPIVQLSIDQSGAGNWRSFKINPGMMPFVPKDVALQSVSISDGVLILSGPNRDELVRFEGVNGVLSAEALEGPYKFAGSLQWGGMNRHVRLVTARQDANGDVRMKVSVDAVESGNAYVFDGRIGDLAGKPRIEGDLSAKLDFALNSSASGIREPPLIETLAAPPESGEALPGPGSEAPPAAEAAKEPDGPPRFDLRTKVRGDTSGLDLTDISVTLEQGGAPQIITGSARVAWTERVNLDVALASRWLDLDRMVGGPEADMVPLAAARKFFEQLAALLPAEADTKALLEFDQLNLGGEAVSGVRLAASRTNGPLEISGVRASLPGGTRLELDGVLTPGTKVPRLNGNLWIAGQSLMRFLSWGFREKSIAADRSDGPFSIEGKFALGETTVELVEAAAEFSGMQLSGDVRLGLGERRRLALALDGSRIDVGQIAPGAIGLGILDSIIFGRETRDPVAEGRSGKPSSPALGDEDTDIALKLRVAELVDGALTLRDVESELSVERGRLAMPVLKFSTPEGLVVEAEGSAVDVPAAPKGAVRAVIDAPGREAASAFLGLVGLTADRLPAADRLARLAPFRLAGTLDLRGRSDTAVDLTLDGTMQGGRARATFRLDGGRKNWRTAPVDIGATIENPDIERLLAVLLEIPDMHRRDTPTAPGRMVVKAVGTPESGVTSLAAVTAEGLTLDLNGTARLPAEGAMTASGRLAVAAADSRLPLALAGIPLPRGASGVPMTGNVAVALDGSRLGLDTSHLRIGESTVTAKLSLVRSESGKRAVSGEIDTDAATFAGLLAPLLGAAPAAVAEQAPVAPAQSRGAASAPAPEPAAEVAGIWPQQPFDVSGLSRIEGQIAVHVGSLSLEPGLAIGNARFKAAFGDTGVRIDSLEGEAIGGKLTSSLDIEKAAAGVTASGTLRIDISGAGDGPKTTDATAFSAEFSGRGLSPDAIIADLEGKGEITIGNATLTGMSPSAVTQVVENALAGKGPVAGEALAEALKASLEVGELELGKIAVPVSIQDGALKLGKVQIESKEGRSTFTTVIELSSMKIDSEWQIEPKVARAGVTAGDRVVLPAISVIYVGKLSNIAGLEPRVVTGAIERELQVRKMERDVEELERLRKLDQTRAKEEQERQKALEAERLRTAPPPQDVPAPTPQSAAPPGPDGSTAPLPQDADGASAATVEPPEVPQTAAGPDDGAAQVPPGAAGTTAANASGIPGDPAVPSAVTEPGPPRPARKKRPPVEEWRPFQTTPF